jgi:hypothetical protein
MEILLGEFSERLAPCRCQRDPIFMQTTRRADGQWQVIIPGLDSRSGKREARYFRTRREAEDFVALLEDEFARVGTTKSRDTRGSLLVPLGNGSVRRLGESSANGRAMETDAPSGPSGGGGFASGSGICRGQLHARREPCRSSQLFKMEAAGSRVSRM